MYISIVTIISFVAGFVLGVLFMGSALILALSLTYKAFDSTFRREGK